METMEVDRTNTSLSLVSSYIILQVNVTKLLNFLQLIFTSYRLFLFSLFCLTFTIRSFSIGILPHTWAAMEKYKKDMVMGFPLFLEHLFVMSSSSLLHFGNFLSVEV